MAELVLYMIYVAEWKKSHPAKKGFKGCRPACFPEWKDCELKDMLSHPDWYCHSHGLVAGLVSVVREKQARTIG